MISVRDHTPPSRPTPGKSIKFPRGKKNGIARKHLVRTTTQDVEQGLTKGPFVPPRVYDIVWDPEVVEAYMTKWEAKGYLKLRPECLKWSPFLIARTMKSEGLPEEGTQESDALQTPLDESALELGDFVDAVATPRAGPSSISIAASKSKSKGKYMKTKTPRNRQPVEGMASPALNLFDEPVEEDQESGRPDPDELPTLQDDEGEVTVGKKGRRTKGEEEDVVLRRSGRHSTAMSLSTSPSQTSTASPQKPTPKARPRRIRTTSMNGTAQVNRDGTGKPEPPASELDDMESLIADDAALAKRLAMEDGMPRRELRSRSNTSQEVRTLTQVRAQKRPAPPPPPASVSVSRKRRRVDTSPEPPSSPPVRQAHTRRSSGTVNSRKVLPPTPTTPSTPGTNAGSQRRSTRRTNGVTTAPSVDDTPSPELRRTRSGGARRRRVQSEDPETDGERGDPADPEVEEPLTATTAQFPGGGPGRSASAHADEVKYEDMDTPLTTGTSRQSAPSDDTVYVPEDQRMKETPVSPVALVPPPTVINGTHAVGVGGEEDDDPDAEGEDDIDAEGEEDTGDADLDVDAEGEHDLGDDVDAEGEPDDGLDAEDEVVMMI